MNYNDKKYSHLVAPCLSADGKHLFCNAIDAELGKPNLLMYLRETTKDPFKLLGVVGSGDFKIIAPKNGAFVRYLPDSNELFFAGEVGDTGEKSRC